VDGTWFRPKQKTIQFHKYRFPVMSKKRKFQVLHRLKLAHKISALNFISRDFHNNALKGGGGGEESYRIIYKNKKT
jgi:hypothetical protein